MIFPKRMNSTQFMEQGWGSILDFAEAHGIDTSHDGWVSEARCLAVEMTARLLQTDIEAFRRNRKRWVRQQRHYRPRRFTPRHHATWEGVPEGLVKIEEMTPEVDCVSEQPGFIELEKARLKTREDALKAEIQRKIDLDKVNTQKMAEIEKRESSIRDYLERAIIGIQDSMNRFVTIEGGIQREREVMLKEIAAWTERLEQREKRVEADAKLYQDRIERELAFLEFQQKVMAVRLDEWPIGHGETGTQDTRPWEHQEEAANLSEPVLPTLFNLETEQGSIAPESDGQSSAALDPVTLASPISGNSADTPVTAMSPTSQVSPATEADSPDQQSWGDHKPMLTIQVSDAVQGFDSHKDVREEGGLDVVPGANVLVEICPAGKSSLSVEKVSDAQAEFEASSSRDAERVGAVEGVVERV